MKLLDGWGEIAARLTTHAGVTISIDQAKRYAMRQLDPLPVKRIGRHQRQRVAGDPNVVDAWARAEFT